VFEATAVEVGANVHKEAVLVQVIIEFQLSGFSHLARLAYFI
jgi:hypothetical protein